MASGGITQFRRAIARMALQGEGPLTLEEILTDRALLQCFKRFCADDASIENLLFCLEAMEYQQIASADFRRFRARQIHRKYTAASAPMGVGVAGFERARIEAALASAGGGAVDTYLFDAVLHDVVFSLRYDIYPRFLGSSAYAALVARKLEATPEAAIDDFELLRFLGAGGFGMVLLAQHRVTQKYYAMKVIDKRIVLSQNQTHSIFREKEASARRSPSLALPTRRCAARSANTASCSHRFPLPRRCSRRSSIRSSSRSPTPSKRPTTSASSSTSSAAVTCTPT